MNEERLMTILLAPHISEKSTVSADQNRQFVFKVATDASKNEIKSAVEMLFNVEVDKVRVINVKGKTKQRGLRKGRRSDWKKAYVALKPGSDIEFMGAE